MKNIEMRLAAKEAFEEACYDWGLDFDSWNEDEHYYEDFATGCTFGTFELGWEECAKKHGVENV